MIASMMRAAGVLLIVAGSLYGATAANEAMLCAHLPFASNPDLAIGYCTAAIESGGLPDAGLAAVLDRRCVAYGKKRDFARALPDCERAIQLAPYAALPVYRRGWIRLYSGNLDGAMLDFEQAIRRDPNIALAYRGRASVHARRAAAANCSASSADEYDRAIEGYGDALRLMQDGETYYQRGLARMYRGYYDSAVTDLDEAIRRGSGAKAYYYRGWCYIYVVDYSRAIADFDQSIRLEPNAVAYRSLGLVHTRRGEYDLAIRDYTQAVRLGPDAETYRARGSAFYHKGAYLLALWDFARASWRFWVPLVLLVLLIYALGHLRKAKKAQVPTEDYDESPADDDLEPLVESPDAPREEPVPDPEPLQADTDLDVLIRTGVRNPALIGLAEGLLQEAGIPFLVMEQSEVASQASGNFGWWNIRVPHEREAEAREIIRAVEEMK